MGQLSGQVQGVIAREPNLTYTQAGKAKVQLTLAVNLKRKGYGSTPDAEQTLWVRFTFLGDKADQATRFKKGAVVNVTGTVTYIEQHEKYGLQADAWGDTITPVETKKTDVRVPDGLTPASHALALTKLKGSKHRPTPHDLDYFDDETDTIQCYDPETKGWFTF